MNLRIKQRYFRPEFFGLSVAISALVGAIYWRYQKFAHFPCVFQAVTGIPCCSCGGTHAIAKLMEGKVGEAFVANPLITLSCGIGGVYAVYAFGVLFLKLPAFRFHFSQPYQWRLRVLLVCAILGNWIYLILKHFSFRQL